MTNGQKHQRRSSRLPGFYQRSLTERAAIVAQWANLERDEQAVLFGLSGLGAQQADHMIENVIGMYALPLGIATNFLINGQDYLIPMVVEEPSIVAGVSFAAKLARSGGGFITHADDPVMIGQIQVLDVDNIYAAAGRVWDARDQLLEEANCCDRVMVELGGGARDIELRPFPDTPVGPMLVIHLLFDVRDAMGANAINTTCERLAPMIEEITGGRVNLRILSNLADHRKAAASCMIPADSLGSKEMPGAEVVRGIVEAAAFAEVDPYRATTHNKGVMNGMDAVAIATGNDWRALEAGAHAWAARSGRYTSMTEWWQDDQGDLRGRIELPVAVGTVGGATRVHPTARVALKILGVQSASELAQVMVAAGLAQNLAAIRALATEGIQRGHMSLHAKQMAVAAGAVGEEVLVITRRMVEEGKISDRARGGTARGTAEAGLARRNMANKLEAALKALYLKFRPVRGVIGMAASAEKSLYARGILPAGRLNLPDFLGIGATRAGTTWLDRNLRAHPDLFLPEQKELHYFDRHYDTGLYVYTRWFRAGRDKVKGEITPAYGVLPVERIRFIRAIMPDVRLIFIMRNPIERSWSEAVYNVRRAANVDNLDDVPLDVFRQLLDSEATVSRSDYLRTLDQWLSVFPQEQLYVAFFELIYQEPQTLLTAVFEHLGVRTDIDWAAMPYREKFNVNPKTDIPAEIRALLEERYCAQIEQLYARFGEVAAGGVERC